MSRNRICCKACKKTIRFVKDHTCELMTKFGGFGKHQNNSPCNNSVKVFRMLSWTLCVVIECPGGIYK